MIKLNDKDITIININNVTYIENGFRRIIIHFINTSTKNCIYETDEIKNKDLEILTIK